MHIESENTKAKVWKLLTDWMKRDYVGQTGKNWKSSKYLIGLWLDSTNAFVKSSVACIIRCETHCCSRQTNLDFRKTKKKSDWVIVRLWSIWLVFVKKIVASDLNSSNRLFYLMKLYYFLSYIRVNGEKCLNVLKSQSIFDGCLFMTSNFSSFI